MDFKKFLPWIIGAVILFGIYGWVKGINNTAVTLNQNIEESWGNVQTAYQRRNDLIPNIVSTVKGYAEHEKSTLTAVIEARAKATQTTVDPANITPEQLEAFNKAQSGVAGKVGVVVFTPSTCITFVGSHQIDHATYGIAGHCVGQVQATYAGPGANVDCVIVV